MPWKESRVLDQRLQFLSSYQKEEMSVADLCRAYGISRPTAYRWINRYNETGPEGLVDRSRRPHTCSHTTLEPMENATITDAHSRYLIRCQIVSRIDLSQVRAISEAAMRECGVPRTD
jgi:transposase